FVTVLAGLAIGELARRAVLWWLAARAEAGAPVVGRLAEIESETVADADAAADAPPTRPGPRPLVVPLVIALAALVAGPLAALVPPLSGGPGRTVTIAAVQGNVPRLGLDFNAQRRAVLDNHVKETLQLAADVAAGKLAKPDLVIWPEN